VYLVDGASEVMTLAASHNWPERFRPWLGDVRVRLGFGPSGEAAAERRVIEIPDVFAADDLEDWQDVATELGFKSLVALPLQTGNRVLGTVTFYFANAGAHTVASRGLLRIVADQMAATAERAALIGEMRRTNIALLEANEELERQYVEVLDAKRAKDEFLAHISHELRTPLTSVLGYLSILQDERSGPLTPEQRGDLASAKESSERLLELIGDLIELTTLKRGVPELSLDDFDPRQALLEAGRLAEGRRPDVGFRIEESPEVVPFLRSDKKKIVKILVTLLRSAYTSTTSGEVVASVHIRGNRAQYAVRDTGIGIPAAAQKLVFEECRQVEVSSTRSVVGPGLGLALARRLARALGGEIMLESMEGEGSTFTLDLPLASPGLER
jgi:signal transduction histidine kinase